MGILTPVIYATLNLLAVAVDAVTLLTIVRIVRSQRSAGRWLEACDAAGRPLMDPLLRALASRVWGWRGHAIDHPRAAWLLMGGLLLTRWCLSELGGLMTR